MSEEKSGVAKMTAADIMTGETWAVTTDMVVMDVIKELIDRRISGAPLVDNMKAVISVISEADLMKFAAAGGVQRKVSEFMDKLVAADQIVKVKKQDDFKEVFKHFLLNPVRRVIVVDGADKLQGIISRRDILKAFLKAEGEDLDSPKEES